MGGCLKEIKTSSLVVHSQDLQLDSYFVPGKTVNEFSELCLRGRVGEKLCFGRSVYVPPNS